MSRKIKDNPPTICASCQWRSHCGGWCGGRRFATGEHDPRYNPLRKFNCPLKREKALLVAISLAPALRKITKEDAHASDALAEITTFTRKGRNKLVRNCIVCFIDIGDVGTRYADVYVKAVIEDNDLDENIMGYHRYDIHGDAIRIIRQVDRLKKVDAGNGTGVDKDTREKGE